MVHDRDPRHSNGQVITKCEKKSRKLEILFRRERNLILFRRVTPDVMHKHMNKATSALVNTELFILQNL